MPQLKIFLLGDEAVGKTCLLIKFTTGSFPDQYMPVVVDNYMQSMTVDDIQVDLVIGDSRGGDEYDRRRYLSSPYTDLFILAFSIASPPSFDSIKTKWLPEMKEHSPNTPFVLVGTKTDLRFDYPTLDALEPIYGHGPLDKSCGEELATEIGAVEYLETSAVRGEGVNELFEEVVKIIRRRAHVEQGRAPHKAQRLSKCALM